MQAKKCYTNAIRVDVRAKKCYTNAKKDMKFEKMLLSALTAVVIFLLLFALFSRLVKFGTQKAAIVAAVVEVMIIIVFISSRSYMEETRGQRLLTEKESRGEALLTESRAERITQETVASLLRPR